MSEAASKPADSGHELDEIADELYALPPDGFASARDEQVRTARAAGRQPLARELAKLRKPTQSAWLINLLWRDQREVMEQLLVLGEELSRAQAEASGPELQRLMAVRRALEAGLIRTARALAQQAGVSVSASMEREAQETLSAALAQPEVAAEVRTGRLVKPASYAGFGTVIPATLRTNAQPRSAPPTPVEVGPAPPAEPATDEIALRVALRARERRAVAERDVAEARAALEQAAEALAERGRAVDAARQQLQALHAQVTELQRQLRETQQKQIPAAEDVEVAATVRRDQAEKAHATAQQALERAERSLQE